MGWKRKHNQTEEEIISPIGRGRRGRLVNLLGILLALGIFFGGMSGVEKGLLWEEERLLRGGGKVGVTILEGQTKLQEGVSWEDKRRKLEEGELVLAVGGLEEGEDIWLHEPGQGQLSMEQAMTDGKEWLENFCLPHLGVTGFDMGECKVSCYLWTFRDVEVGSVEANGACSYWTFTAMGGGMEAELLLSAQSGQVLYASVSCGVPVASQDAKEMKVFLEDYVASFGLEGKGEAVQEPGLIYKAVGDGELSAVIRPFRVVSSKVNPDTNTLEHMETFNIRIYLARNFTT